MIIKLNAKEWLKYWRYLLTERLKKWKCYRKGHEWEILYDERGISLIPWDHDRPDIGVNLPSRKIAFACTRCGKVEKHHRWAFGEGSGALTHFYGREW